MSRQNQYNHNRNWREEVAKTCSRLCLCAIVPCKWTANSKITTICLHGVKNTTTVHRLTARQFCCKSQASKAHDPLKKRKAAEVAWNEHRDLLLQRQKERWNRPGEKDKHSKAMLRAIENLRGSGWSNPGWGWSPTDEERKLPGTLYLVRYLDESGTHFKLGITKRALSERFKPGQLISIIHLHHATLGECFDLEQSLLKWAKENNYRYSSPTTTELILPEAVPHVLARIKVEP